MIKKTGFTLIELVVVVGALGIIMITVTAIMINSFKAKNRVESITTLEQSGDILFSSFKNNIFNTSGIGISCVVNGVSSGSTLALTNVNNGEITNLVCYEGDKIASESANGNFQLTSSGVGVSGCDDFARCEMATGNDASISKINFLFYLRLGDGSSTPVNSVIRKFENSVTVRN